LFLEDFKNLENWKPLYFPKIDRYTSYTIESKGKERYLKTESDSSASGIVYKNEFNVYAFPKVRWEWKIENVYQNGDSSTKSGDDYPLRLYIIFKYNPDTASFVERVKYNAAKLLYGEYPPYNILSYIWANKKHKETVISNVYTSKSKMVLLQEGKANAGKWISQDVNIVNDYRRAFGVNPPALVNIAIMNDSDNTGESSVSYVRYIEVYNDTR